jgi:predicted anti-sigma-YlaC factor YlaD
MRDKMTAPEMQHLTADELDALLEGEGSHRVTSHLATCSSCLAMFELDRQLVGMLSALPAFNPSVDFEARIMAQVKVGPAITIVPTLAPSPREVAARRRVLIGSLAVGGSVIAGFAWAMANPAAALGAVAPALRQTGEALWVSLQTVASNATEQPWFNSLADTLASPGKALLALVAVGGLYALALTGFRRLLTEPAADARW